MLDTKVLSTISLILDFYMSWVIFTMYSHYLCKRFVYRGKDALDQETNTVKH